MFDAHKLIKVPMITAKLNYWASGSSNQKQLKRFPRLSAVALHTNNILCHFLVIKAAISTMADTNQSLVMLMPIQINISNSSNMPEHYAMNQHARVIGSAVTCLNKKLFVYGQLFLDAKHLWWSDRMASMCSLLPAWKLTNIPLVWIVAIRNMFAHTIFYLFLSRNLREWWASPTRKKLLKRLDVYTWSARCSMRKENL